MSSTFPTAPGPPASKQPKIKDPPTTDLTPGIRALLSLTEKEVIQNAFAFC